MAPRVTTTTKEPDVLTYLIRDIDADLWGRFRARAEHERIPMRTLLLHFTRLYVDGGLAMTAHVLPAGRRSPRKR